MTPTDVQRTKGLATLPNLREVGRGLNQRLLEAEHLSLSFAVSTPMVDRIQQPLGVGSRRVAEHPRVLALLQALCSSVTCRLASAIAICVRRWRSYLAGTWPATRQVR
jgi:hypothetical protein